MSKLIKTPLRYPGGKSRAIQDIETHFPVNLSQFNEYREPFIGGGSVFIYLKQKYPHLTYWINDLNPELYYFWKIAQSDLDKLITEIKYIKNNNQDGKALFQNLTSIDTTNLTELERATRFFILNRITFSGTVEAGGYSEQAFLRRFTDSSIARLAKIESILKDVKITNLDYSQLLETSEKKVFIFLDPPYFTATKSRLYGKRGNLHTNFEHQQFANKLKECSHKWLITYDDSVEIRKNFYFAHIYEWELQYGMNNYKQKKANKGQELMITNYLVKQIKKESQQLSLNL